MDRTARFAIFALALSAFAIGTTEFVIMGLLPRVASDLQVSLPSAGLLISGYALGVTVGGPLLAIAMAGLPGRRALVALMTLFVVGNVACALSPGYGWLMTARIVTAFCHAAFFGIGAVIAASLAEPRKRTQAMALMFVGLTTANVIGVPLGTFIGQAFGWRATFWTVAAAGALSWIALVRWIPVRASEPRDLRQELVAIQSPAVALTLLMSVAAASSLFILFTYVTPILMAVSGLAEHQVAWALLLCGIGLSVGNLGGARFADWRPLPSLAGVLLALSIVLFMFTSLGGTPITGTVVLSIWGAVGFAALSILQGYVVQRASAAPNLASILNISAFNLGNAIGAALGALALDQGVSLRSIPNLAAIAALVTLTLCVVAWRLEQKSRRGVAAAPI